MTEELESTPGAARAAGDRFYFTGTPCKRGHSSLRYTSTRQCTECVREHRLQWSRVNPDKIRGYNRKWLVNNPDKRQELNKKWCAKNPEKAREMRSKAGKKWYLNNPAAANSYAVKYRADKDNRTPAWADLEAIKFFYECCPAGCHVDHIVPLRGELISGLHVAENLQWLPSTDNLVKGNRFDIGGECA